MSQTHADSLQPGDLFNGRYRVVRRIKAGAMGAVYEVTDERTKRPLALKIMLPEAIEDADLRKRFQEEARITGPIESDHIVKVTDAAEDQATGHLFLVMELLQGEDLGQLIRKLIRQRKSLPPEEALYYLRQLAFALDKTHAKNIIHRDLKPDNLFVTTRDDGSKCLKILDFGIAKVLEDQNLHRTRALGTPLYMAPEQARGDDVGPATDLYALGQIAYTMLVGEAYWRGDEAAKDGAEAIRNRVMWIGTTVRPSERALIQQNATLPTAFDEWFFKATALNPKHRFESGRAAIEALAAALGLPARDAMPSVIDMGESHLPAPAVSPGVVYRTAAIPITTVVLPDRALGDTNRPTLPFPVPKAVITQPLPTQSNADDGLNTIVVPGSGSGPLGATNLTATSQTWVKPLQGRTGVLAAALVGVIVTVGVVEYAVRDGEQEKKATLANAEVVASVAVTASIVPSAVAVVASVAPSSAVNSNDVPPSPMTSTSARSESPAPVSSAAPRTVVTAKNTGSSKRLGMKLDKGMQ